MALKKTVIIGASVNPDRYSYKAAHTLMHYNHPIEMVGLREGELFGIKIHADRPVFENVDTVTMYVGPVNQASYIDYIISLNPKRVIFNPGSENLTFEETLRAKGIEVEEACTLVMLRTGSY